MLNSFANSLWLSNSLKTIRSAFIFPLPELSRSLSWLLLELAIKFHYQNNSHCRRASENQPHAGDPLAIYMSTHMQSVALSSWRRFALNLNMATIASGAWNYFLSQPREEARDTTTSQWAASTPTKNVADNQPCICFPNDMKRDFLFWLHFSLSWPEAEGFAHINRGESLGLFGSLPEVLFWKVMEKGFFRWRC